MLEAETSLRKQETRGKLLPIATNQSTDRAEERSRSKSEKKKILTVILMVGLLVLLATTLGLCESDTCEKTAKILLRVATVVQNSTGTNATVSVA